MKTKIIFVAVLLATSAMLAPLGQADQQQDRAATQEDLDNLTVEELEQLRADAMAKPEVREWLERLNQPSDLDATLAAELYVRQVILDDLTDDERIELAIFLRGLNDPNLDSIIAEEFAVQTTQGILSAEALPIARDRVTDKAAFDSLMADGTFERLSPAEAMEVIASLGFAATSSRNAEFDGEAILESMREILPAAPLSSPWQAQHWNELAITLGLVYLVLAGTSPVAGSEFLPHNFQITALYIDAKATAGSDGGWTHFHVWAQLTVDTLLGVAFDIRNNVDNILLQLPLSIRVTLHFELRCGWTGCYYAVYPTVSFPATTIGTNMVYEHAIPAMAGQQATRAESSDILMPIYDALGRLTHQKGREATSAPAALPPEVPAIPNDPGRPGLGDLGTESPIANYFGLQGDFSAVPATPALPGPVSVPDVRERQRGSFGTPGDSTGTTVGHTSTALHAWELNIIIVRLGNIGTGTNGVGPEPPASLYYDAGSYFTGGGPNQYTSDFSIRANISP